MQLAIKIIDKSKANSKLHKVYLPRELAILRKLRSNHHPNIIDVPHILDDAHYCCIIQEFAVNGDLFDYVMARGKLPEEEARWFFVQLCSAVAHCHANGIIHRDIKMDNIFLDRGMNVRLGGKKLTYVATYVLAM